MKLPDQCFRAVDMLRNCSRFLIVHHWDSDGIASAAMLGRFCLNSKSRVDYLVPKIGVYGIEALTLKDIPCSVDCIVVLDYSVDGRVFEKLKLDLERDIVVFDHHVVNPCSTCKAYCNPVALGQGDEEVWPSTTYLLYKFLSPSIDSEDLVVLGIVGDLTPYVDSKRGHRGLSYINDLLPKLRGLSLTKIRFAVDLVDSCYRVLNYDCIEYVRTRLIHEGLSDILNDPYLIKIKKEVDEVISKALSSLRVLRTERELSVFHLKMDAFITSSIGRLLASNNPDRVITLVHEIPSLGGGFIYVRSVKYVLEDVLIKLKRAGLEVGGKKAVFVVRFKGDYSDVLNNVIDKLLNNLPH